MINLVSPLWRIEVAGAFAALALVLLVVGCAEGELTSQRIASSSAATGEDANGLPSSGEKRPRTQATASDRQTESSERQLIYSARISVETPEFEQFAQQLQDRVEMLGGFIANYQDQRRTGTRQSGKWTVRVEAAKFSDLVNWLDEAASVVSKLVSSQDVTEEFVDLTARLANKKNTESRLIKLLDDRPGSLEEVLVVERELDRVREEIERMEGRLRFLGDRVALSMIEITANTRVEYQVQDIALGERLRESWQTSLDGLRRASENSLIVLVGLLPWSLPFGLVCIVAAFGYRVVRKLR